MFINETITATMDAMRSNSIRAEQLRNVTRKRWTPEQYSTETEKRAAFKQLQSDTAQAADALQVLEIENKIIRDNLRRMIYNAVIPAALDILRKYNGKPYGEKTRSKISDEMKAHTGCAMYLSSRYDIGKIDITPLDAHGYTNCAFRYNDFDIYTKQHMNVLSGNKINGSLTADDLYLSDCPAQVSDPHAHALKIIEEFRRIKDSYSAFERELSAFNSLLPSDMDRRSVREFRNYL